MSSICLCIILWDLSKREEYVYTNIEIEEFHEPEELRLEFGISSNVKTTD